MERGVWGITTTDDKLHLDITNESDYSRYVYPYALSEARLGRTGAGLFSVMFWRGDNWIGLVF